MARPRKTQSSTNVTSSTTSASASASTTASVRARKRTVAAAKETQGSSKGNNGGGPAASGDGTSEDSSTMPSWTVRNRWIVFAVASGACAAFNGVFAKLTTNDLSTQIAQGISGFLGLTDLEKFVEVVVRAAFFGLNLAFNGVMWSLFTQALAKGNSTTQVSIMNTSTNFMITALLGLIIFSESLPPLWWVGAAMLVAGNVIIGRGNKQEEGDETVGGSEEPEYHDDDDDDDRDAVSAAELGRAVAQTEGIVPIEKDDEDEDEDVALLGDLS
ncbi:hypothetical protein M434DRAFT_202926 [Hypoxylon sp. CO27-5]|nr:hypothetical protein M434DRAFT_202926 [Hypoxylon sp. CO27-5]